VEKERLRFLIGCILCLLGSVGRASLMPGKGVALTITDREQANESSGVGG
jgi:hypothetical protein